MPPRRIVHYAALLTLALASPSLALAQVPAVVVSIKPLHALVSLAMDGVGEPVLLLKTSADPHTYSLKPSEAQALNRAQLVVWVGPGLEAFLEKPVAALAGKAKILRLETERSLTLHKTREGGPWEAEEAGGAGKGHAHGHGHHHGQTDGHVWLDPQNAAAIVRVVARELSALDKPNAAAYARNAADAAQRLQALDREIVQALAPVKGRRYVVFHDSLQYFEKRYRLAAAGSITVSPERPPSAKRLHDIRARILSQKIVCVFGEAQHSDTLVKTVVEATPARTAKLDTDGGIGIAEGKDAYFALMRNLTATFTGCLAGKAS